MLHNDANLAMLARMNQVYHHLLQVLLKGSMDHPRHELSGQVSISTNQQQQPMRVLSTRLMLAGAAGAFTLLHVVAAADVTHLSAMRICQ